MKNKAYEIIRKYFYWFFIYSVVGWIYEVIIYLVNGHGFVNRGFLFGPYLPVYGFGAILIIALFYRLVKKKVKLLNINIMPIIIFLLIVVFTTVLEYITSWFVQIAFNMELWNYSNWSINFQGRIALVPSLRFGILGILLLYFVQPLLFKLVDKLNEKIKNIIFFTLLVIILIDLAITLCLMFI